MSFYPRARRLSTRPTSLAPSAEVSFKTHSWRTLRDAPPKAPDARVVATSEPPRPIHVLSFSPLTRKASHSPKTGGINMRLASKVTGWHIDIEQPKDFTPPPKLGGRGRGGSSGGR